MNANDAALEMISDSGIPMPTLSRTMGRDRTFLITTVGRGNIPRADTLSKIADACGYDLVLRRRIDEYEITIDPYD